MSSKVKHQLPRSELRICHLHDEEFKPLKLNHIDPESCYDCRCSHCGAVRMIYGKEIAMAIKHRGRSEVARRLDNCQDDIWEYYHHFFPGI